MSEPAKLPLRIRQGATFRKHLLWKSPLGVPIDLTGCVARMQVRPEIESSTVLVELTTENGRILLGGVDGTLILELDPATTAAFDWDSGVYDLEIQHANGDVTALVFGAVSVRKEVTRAA